MKTSSLKALEIDTTILSAKSVDSESVSLKGENVVDIIEDNKQSAKDFIERVEIGDDEYYVIWDNTGQPVKWKTKDDIVPPLIGNSAIKSWSGGTVKYSQPCQDCISLEKFGPTNFDITNMAYAFKNCQKLKTFTGFFQREVTSAYEMFHNCESLEEINCNFDVFNTDLNGAFNNCKSLKSITLNIPKVTILQRYFLRLFGIKRNFYFKY